MLNSIGNSEFSIVLRPVVFISQRKRMHHQYSIIPLHRLLIIQTAWFCSISSTVSLSESFAATNTMIIPPTDEVRKQKQLMRKQIRSSIKALSAKDIEVQSNKVFDRVIELPIYQSAKTIGLFLSMPTGEINTDQIIKSCVQNGKDIYVPEVGEDFNLCDMELRKVIHNDDDDDLTQFHKTWPTNAWAIPEPPDTMPIVTAKPGDIDLMIVPGLGFDRSCNRLGQGKGYYDRFIAKMTTNGYELPLLAVALTPQLVDDKIPVAEYDRKMDLVVLPDEIIQ